MALTKRQKQVLDFIANFVDEQGYCPSYEEIARGLELASLATVHKHISVLEAKSYLKRGFNQSRSLELAPKYLQEQRRTRPPVLEIPLLGRIAAGTPVEAVEQREVLNFADGRRNVQQIRDAVSAEYGPVPLEVVLEYLKALQEIGVVEEVK